MSNRQSCWILAVAFMLLAGPGCQRDNAAPNAGDSAAPCRSERSDATTEMTILARYFDDDLVKARQINVDVDGGVARLTGLVDTDQARDRAESIARKVDGVTEVRNELQVHPPEGGAGRATARDPRDQTSASWITTKIQSQYFVSADVKGRKIDVTTSPGGEVTLRGEVDNEKARQEAVRIARATEGVRDVVDELRLAGSPERDADAPNDTWITTKIESKYFLDPDVKGRNIDVKTSNGVVTLTGTVATAAERRQAVAMARATDGVREVRDELRLDDQLAKTQARATPSADVDKPNDMWIETKIHAKFFIEDALNDSEIEVSSENGVVTLQGAVPSADAKRAAEEIARETSGVRDVVSRLQVSREAAGG